MAEPLIITEPGIIRKDAYAAADRAIAVLIKNHGTRATFAISGINFRTFVAGVIEAVMQGHEVDDA